MCFWQGDRAHTILLLQQGPAKTSRTFMDFETVTLAMDGKLKWRLERYCAMQRQ